MAFPMTPIILSVGVHSKSPCIIIRTCQPRSNF